MRDEQFEKRMDLLKKSYDRVPSSFDSQEVLRKIEGEARKEHLRDGSLKKHRKFNQKLIVWAVGIASLFLMGILSTTHFLTDDEEQANGEQNEVSEITHPDLEEKYQEARDKKRKTLQLSEAQFSEIPFVEATDRNVKSLLKMLYVPRENVEELFAYHLAELALPSEMVKQLLKNPLREDENASILFMTQYREHIADLISFYSELVVEEEGIHEGLLAAMKAQRIQLIEPDNRVSYVPHAGDEKVKEALHEVAGGYYNMLLQEPYMIGDSLIYSLAETAVYLQEMESVLLKAEEQSHLYLVMRGYYFSLFNHIVKGSVNEPVVDDNGIVKEAYQEVWKQLATGEPGLPTSYIMRPIVEEMEATGWRSSSRWDAFTYKEVEDMLILAQEGMLPK